MTAPKLTRIAWPKSEFATTGEWLNSLLPKPPPRPPTEPPPDPKQQPRGGSELGRMP